MQAVKPLTTVRSLYQKHVSATRTTHASKTIQYFDICDRLSSPVPGSVFCGVYLPSDCPSTHPQVFGGMAKSLFTSSIFGPSVGVGTWTPSAQPDCTVWIGPGQGTDRAAGRPAKSPTKRYRRSYIFFLNEGKGRGEKWLGVRGFKRLLAR
jgi:hypothetical protein